MDGESLCTEYYDFPPSPSPALSEGSNESPSDSPRLQMYQPCPRNKSAQVGTYWPLEELATTTLYPLDQNTSWNIWLPKWAAHLAPTTEYLGIRPRRICGFFFQVLLFFSAPSCLREKGFLGTFHAWFILRAPRRNGETAPLLETTEDKTTSSLLIQNPSSQKVHVLLLVSQHVLNTCILIFRLGLQQQALDPECLILPLPLHHLF